jgi:hypothetical protein
MKNAIFTIVFLIIIWDIVTSKLNSRPAIIPVRKLPYNYNSMTIPPFGILVQVEDLHNKRLIKHELEHWKQYMQLGFIMFYRFYFFQLLLYGYDKMPLEVNARIAAGEDTYCLHNYTYCVKNGYAKTISDPEFRN